MTTEKQTVLEKVSEIDCFLGKLQFLQHETLTTKFTPGPNCLKPFYVEPSLPLLNRPHPINLIEPLRIPPFECVHHAMSVFARSVACGERSDAGLSAAFSDNLIPPHQGGGPSAAGLQLVRGTSSDFEFLPRRPAVADSPGGLNPPAAPMLTLIIGLSESC